MMNLKTLKQFLITALLFACMSLVHGQSLNIPSKPAGISFGNSTKFNGLRLNFIDRNIQTINGINFTIWNANEDEELSGTINGLSIGLPMAFGSEDRNGVSLALFGAGAERNLSGIQIGGIAVGAGSNLSGINIGGIAAGGGNNLSGISIGGLAVGAGQDVKGISIAGLVVGAGGKYDRHKSSRPGSWKWRKCKWL